jgi:hypothetical protein
MPRQPGVWERKNPDGSLYAFYTTIDGRQHRLRATTRRKAEDELKRLLRTLDAGPAGPEPSVGRVCDLFLADSQTEN